jgi:O-antigen/teichoic acid export membrane protein
MADQEQPPPLPLVPFDQNTVAAVGQPPPLSFVSPEARDDRLSAAPAEPEPARPVSAPATVRVATPLLAGGVTIYLARALHPHAYGVYALAVAIGAVGLFAAWVALPLLAGRFADADADVPEDPAGRIAPPGPKLQLVAATLCAAALFAAAGLIADGYGTAGLQWPLRWVAVAILAQGMVFVMADLLSGSTRQAQFGIWLTAAQGGAQALDIVALVASGRGAAGAVLGQITGSVFGAAGLFLLATALAPGPEHAATRRRRAQAAAVGEVTWVASVFAGIVVVAALVPPPALGRLGVALAFVTAVGWTVHELSGALTDTAAAPAPARQLRIMVVAAGATVAPLLVWADPLDHLLFGHAYGAGSGALRALAFCALAAGPALLLTMIVTRRADVRPRLLAASFALEVGLIATYLLTRADGITGAAIGIDVLIAVSLGVHLWIAARLVDLELRWLARSLQRSAAAALAMAAVLYAAGTGDLSVLGWVSGSIGGIAAFAAVLLITGEISFSRPPPAPRLGRSREAS